MQRVFILLIGLSIFLSCKNVEKSQNSGTTTSVGDKEKTAEQNDGLTRLKGEFVYYDGAAVLQTHTEIYGVLLTNKFDALNKRSERFKAKPTDHVLVEVWGKITNEKHKTILWENKVEIVEIIDVKPDIKEQNNIIELGS